ncbi:hypothetical protein [Aliiroseovarius crassostreae]|uniref:hypothetical protein n=1 Tax=Aliiroseovarius crassostreae TaxID=154981 RepID=UPI003C7C9FDF
MDISAPSPISAQATAAAHNALRELPDATKVAPSTNVSNTRADPHTANGHGNDDRSTEARQIIANRERVRDPSTQPGPTPTFQITLLEVEQDLMNILARIEASRAKDRDAEALKPPPSDDVLEAQAMSIEEQAVPPDPAPSSADLHESTEADAHTPAQMNGTTPVSDPGDSAHMHEAP